MPEPLPLDPAQLIQLERRDLETLLAYVTRIRALKIARDGAGKPAGVQPNRDQLKALVNLKRGLRNPPRPAAASEEPATPGAPTPGPPLPEFYGIHRIIPEDWQPTARTLEWATHYLQEQAVAFDMPWLVAEFVSFWRSRAKAMASWQQAFRNNILMKHARGIPLAPPHPRTGPGAGSGRVPGERIYDRTAELRRQRIADFDLEARGYRRSDPVGSPPRRPVGPDD